MLTKKRDRLTEKQEKFIRNIVMGMTQIDAYKDAYDCKGMSDNAISREASLLMKNPKITQRHSELGAKTLGENIMTAQERLEYLSKILTDEVKEKIVTFNDGVEAIYERPADLNTKLKTIDLMNKMQGEYVQKIEADVNTEVTINIELSDD